MIKKVLFYIILVTSYTTYSQSIGTERLSEFKKELLASDTNLIVEYFYYCSGESFYSNDIDNCKNESPKQIFWIKNNMYFKQKFSDCKVYQTIKIESSDFLTTVNQNIDIIKDSEILPTIHKFPTNVDGYQEVIQLEVSHSCNSTFIIITKDQTIIKKINNFDLQTEMVDEDIPNDNYEHNQNSILNTLVKLVNKELK